jgi:opacity protein-like surface antigen
MKKQTIALIAATTLFSAAGASAQQASASPWYGELGYTQLKIEDSSGAPAINVGGNGGMLRGIVGYDLHPNAAVEGMLGLGIRKADVNGSFGGVAFTGDLKLEHMLGVFIKPKFQAGPVELFARAGVTQTKVKATVRVGAASASSSDSGSDFAYGLGAKWQFSRTAYVGLDYMSYYDKDSTKLRGTTLSIGTRW